MPNTTNLRDEIKPTAYMPLLSDSAHFELRTAGQSFSAHPGGPEDRKGS